MKKSLIKIWESLASAFVYFIRPEIDLAHRFVNIILLSVLMLLPPSIVITIAIGTDLIADLFLTGLFVIIAFFIWLINSHPNKQWPIVSICILVNCILLPIMYFICGGRACGMMCWLIFGNVLSYLLIKGRFFFVYFLLTIVTFTSTLLVEEMHPEYVQKLSTTAAETTDTIIAFAMVSLAISLVFKYQEYLYIKQNKDIFENDKKLREMNRELEAASLAKTNFLTNMSHEIRTPINAILGMNEMILRDASDSSIQSYAGDIESAGRQLLSLINDILDISKIEAGKLELTPDKYELFSILNDSYNLVISRAKQKNLSLVINNDSLMPCELYGDEVRIRQIIINLLTNAIKYTEKGSITLKCGYEKIDENNILLKMAVKDTGVGISEKDKEKLFTNFTRLDEQLHKNVEGTGLGLAITKQLIELMGGTITMESVYGEGSEFEVCIPQRVISWNAMGEYTLGQGRKVISNATSRENFTAENAAVLAVDDVRVNLNVVRLLLRDTKVQIDLAESGREALELMSKKHYDLVLMDHMMPEMDGIEALHHIRNDAEILDKKVPVVALTANAISGVDRMYMDEGFDGYLAKPIRAVDLESTLLKFLPAEVVKRNK